MCLGVNINTLAKIMKLADPQDAITLQADKDSSTLNIQFDNEKSDRVTNCKLNLINIDSESLVVPDNTYSSEVTINSIEFSRICRELNQLSDSLTI